MFRIGEFSKITQVPGSQLRYYDEIGLLNPAKIDKWTGYRYYSAKQIPDLNRILALKELGLSLDQIRRMVEDNAPAEEIRGMLTLKKAQAEQTVMDEINRLRRIEARLNQMESGVQTNDINVVLKSLPASQFLSTRFTCPDFSHARDLMFEMFSILPETVGQKNMGVLTALMHNDIMPEADIDLEIGFLWNGTTDQTLTLPSGHEMRVRLLPAVTAMLTATIVGLPDESFYCRGAMANWMETNDYQFDGLGREVFLVPPLPGKEAETVLEIQYPVKPSQPAELPA